MMRMHIPSEYYTVYRVYRENMQRQLGRLLVSRSHTILLARRGSGLMQYIE